MVNAMLGKIIGGAVGSFFGPLGTGVGIALGDLFDSDDDSTETNAIKMDDSLNLALKFYSDIDGLNLFLQAQNAIPKMELIAVINIIESNVVRYVKAKDCPLIPSLFYDDDRDISIKISFTQGTGEFYIPYGVVNHTTSGDYKLIVSILGIEETGELKLIGKEMFILNLPSPCPWYRCTYLRPLIGLIMTISRIHGDLDKATVKKVREFIEGCLEVPTEERNELKKIIKTEPSDDVSTLTLDTIRRLHISDAADLMGLLLDFSKDDGFYDRKTCELLKDIAKALGVSAYDYNQYDKFIKDHYSILGIEPTADIEKIRYAYRIKMKDYHPDKVATLPIEFQELANQKSIEIRQSYEYIIKKHQEA